MTEKVDRVVVLALGEVVLRSPAVRVRMVRKILEDIKRKCKREGIKVNLWRRYGGRIVLYSDNIDKLLDICSKTFGIASTRSAYVSAPDINSIKEVIAKIIHDIEFSTFAVRANIASKYDLSKREVEAALGDFIREITGAKVDLESPDVTFYVEIREDFAYISTSVIEGLYGLPYGTSGKVLCLVSGGVDSAVASWLAMKRGCRPIFVFFDMEKYTGISVEDVKNVLKKLWEYMPEKPKLYVYPLYKVHEQVDFKRSRCLFCKACMYYLSSQLARRLGCKLLITGEAIGQVASQTIPNLAFLSRFAEVPIVRPVCCMDKFEIEKIARKIGVYDVCKKGVKCLLAPKRPVVEMKEEEYSTLQKSFMEKMKKLDSTDFKQVTV